MGSGRVGLACTELWLQRRPPLTSNQLFKPGARIQAPKYCETILLLKSAITHGFSVWLSTYFWTSSAAMTSFKRSATTNWWQITRENLVLFHWCLKRNGKRPPAASSRFVKPETRWLCLQNKTSIGGGLSCVTHLLATTAFIISIKKKKNCCR